ncbi:MAG: hypothetical protein HY873_07470 [Chloroflexi bacterium]|nr:hypothetical protein [Chloroflexota bacterium]
MINTVMLTAMTWVTSTVGSFIARIKEERGQDILEYAVLAGAIAIGAGVLLTFFGPDFWDTFGTVIEGCLTFNADECTTGN